MTVAVAIGIVVGALSQQRRGNIGVARLVSLQKDRDRVALQGGAPHAPPALGLNVRVVVRARFRAAWHGHGGLVVLDTLLLEAERRGVARQGLAALERHALQPAVILQESDVRLARDLARVFDCDVTAVVAVHVRALRSRGVVWRR